MNTTTTTTFNLDGHTGVSINVELTDEQIDTVRQALVGTNPNELYMTNWRNNHDGSEDLGYVNDALAEELSNFALDRYTANWEAENEGKTFNLHEEDENGDCLHDMSDITEGYFCYGYCSGDKSDIQRVTEDLYEQILELPATLNLDGKTTYHITRGLFKETQLNDLSYVAQALHGYEMSISNLDGEGTPYWEMNELDQIKYANQVSNNLSELLYELNAIKKTIEKATELPDWANQED